MLGARGMFQRLFCSFCGSVMISFLFLNIFTLYLVNSATQLSLHSLPIEIRLPVHRFLSK